MRTLRNLATATAIAAAALTMTACAATASGSAGNAATRTTPITDPTTTPGTTASPPTTEPLVLGPTGLGPLQLGMSLNDAKATGLVDHISAPTESCSNGLLKGEHSKPEEAALFVSAHLGVAAIYAYGDIATPEGIKLGSTYDQVHAVYPAWSGIDGNEGHGLVAVPSSGTAKYRIDISNGRVVELDVQLANQDCYE